MVFSASRHVFFGGGEGEGRERAEVGKNGVGKKSPRKDIGKAKELGKLSISRLSGASSFLSDFPLPPFGDMTLPDWEEGRKRRRKDRKRRKRRGEKPNFMTSTLGEVSQRKKKEDGLRIEEDHDNWKEEFFFGKQNV